MVDDDQYINNTSDRIAARSARAEKYMEGRSTGYKAAAKTGLFFANGFDRVSGFFTSEYTGGISGVIFGGIGAALLGTVVAVAVSAFSGGALAGAAPYIIGGFAALGALKTGHAYYKETVNSGRKKHGAHTAERIAEMSGALAPEVTVDPYLAPDEAMRANGRDPDKKRGELAGLEDQSRLQSMQGSTADSTPKSFAERELDRRSRTQATVGTLNPAFNRA